MFPWGRPQVAFAFLTLEGHKRTKGRTTNDLIAALTHKHGRKKVRKAARQYSHARYCDGCPLAECRRKS